jgi:hypothetical protein
MTLLVNLPLIVRTFLQLCGIYTQRELFETRAWGMSVTRLRPDEYALFARSLKGSLQRLKHNPQISVIPDCN